MKKFLAFIVCLATTIVAYAFDFTGKTFRGTSSMNGTKVTITYRFKANNRATGTIMIAGQKPETDSRMLWEVSGDYLNIYDSTGDMSYMEISEQDGKTVLIAFDSYGREAMVFNQVNSTSTAKSGKKK